jgi:L-histidine N-alpha-methyltransferase
MNFPHTQALSMFAQDVLAGLQAEPKKLSSKYFYDEKGSQLFQEIMALSEYYLTDCEFQLLDQWKEEMLEAFASDGQEFHLLELGAGDGSKTKLLLEHFSQAKSNFEYWPIDISKSALDGLFDDLQESLPNLICRPLHGSYEAALAQLPEKGEARRVLLFMGSNIGNFDTKGGIDFLQKLSQQMRSGDLLLLGADLKKAPRQILAAYDDAAGVTAAFNLNLLTRINRELDADFDLQQFEFFPYYDPISGELKSHLLSKIEQTVALKALDQTIEFKAWEPIHTEVSRKYDLEELVDMGEAAGLQAERYWLDEKGWFVNYLFEKG